MKEINYNQYETVTKKCCYLNDNKAVIRNKQLYSLQDILDVPAFENWYIELIKYDNDDTINSIALYQDFGFITAQFDYIYNMTIEELSKALEIWEYKNYEGQKKLVDFKIASSKFINLLDIKIAELAGEKQEYINSLIEYRQEYYNKREAKEQEEQEQKAKAEQDFLNQKKEELNKIIEETEQKILKGENIANSTITIYKDNSEYSDTSLILHLMKKYDIQIPLKTQGWINKALAQLKMNNTKDQYSYSYYSNSANSTVFMEYLQKLIQAIKNAYNIELTTDEQNGIQEQEDMQNYNKNITAPSFTELRNNREQMELNIFMKNNEKHDLTDEEYTEVLKKMYKAIKEKNISWRVTQALEFSKAIPRTDLSKVVVYYGKNNENTLTARAFKIKDSIVILYLKINNIQRQGKDYYCKEVLAV